MAVTHVTALRSAIANAVTAYIDGAGSDDSVLQLRDSTTPIVAFTLATNPAPTFGSASSGIATNGNTPIAAVGIGDGEVDNAILYDTDENAAIMCSVTQTGMGGDIEVDNPNIATGQNCSLESLSYEAPA